MVWATGQIEESLSQKLEFVLKDNRVCRAPLDQHSPHWRLRDGSRKKFAEKGEPLSTTTNDKKNRKTLKTFAKSAQQKLGSANCLIHGRINAALARACG